MPNLDDIKNIAAENDFVRNNDAQPNIIMVIGVGGGGNNAINHMYKQGIKNVTFVVCNTDQQALNNSPVPTKLLIGPNTTHGLGAGNNPDIAKKAAEESCKEINALFDNDLKMVFITAGMGGGTGTGAAPVVARIAKERGLLTIGIVTIPFLFEGEKKILKALDGADEMNKFVDALLVINNERITEIYHDYDFMNAFGKADDTLATAARSISDLITCHGYMNLDFNDVDTTLRNGGAAIISSGYGEGEHRVTKAIEDALNSPLLKNRDVLGSKRLLFNIYFSREAEDKFLMSEAHELTDFVTKVYQGVDVIWGMAFDETLGNKIKITILASGFDITISDEVGAKGPVKIKTPTVRLESEYGQEKIGNLRKIQATANYLILTPNMIDNDAIIDLMEKVPTFNRDKKTADELRKILEKSDQRPDSTASASSAEVAKQNDKASDSATQVIDFTSD